VLHSDFCLPIAIDHNVVSDTAAATPEKVNEKWSSFIHELLWKIENWEHSGQGNGGCGSFDNKVDLGNGDVDFMDEPREQPKFEPLLNCPCKALIHTHCSLGTKNCTYYICGRHWIGIGSWCHQYNG
jgi:hypothetical protein